MRECARGGGEAAVCVKPLDSERISFRGRVWVGSSAALGVVSRKGNGKLRHVRVGQLWGQEQAANGEIAYRKVCGKVNPADLLTKHLIASRLAELLALLQLECRGGKAEAGLELNMVAHAGTGAACEEEGKITSPPRPPLYSDDWVCMT